MNGVCHPGHGDNQGLIDELEAAERVYRSAASLRAWRDGRRTKPAGFPEPVRVGRRVFYSEAEIESWKFVSGKG